MGDACVIVGAIVKKQNYRERHSIDNVYARIHYLWA